MNDAPGLNRRQLLQGLGLASAGLALAPGAVFAGQEEQLFANGTRPLVDYPPEAADDADHRAASAPGNTLQCLQ
ncbi:twin-arginine translocation signal domain-containing protein [Pseudomonas rubra]|uniref:Twin-arginine translocation signal domain-containing protein n=1 Tax=Pseudomonas rubra TaxID=2942627 RepID=A0ABT5P1V3_9PSED|nr:twin-arginine translocation signal domain-containing protein [Pseudomonas rubra]MDD1012220.1 twin-arginine translocation signal domain-containing protein [Pseudomonas rubra]MDD1037433.1 twin-arginine translocation signal domain-containing protein [Pseudomonas rubra]MDD1153150.1 twin-arginine translocation signal domain-containing protein [Pseudomonas rubra]